MNKNLLSYFQKVDMLSAKNPDYQQVLDELFLFFVRNDHVKEDVTAQTFLPGSVAASIKTGVISAKTTCVVAGVEEVIYLAKKHTKLTPKVLLHDRAQVKAGTKIISLTGSAKDILAFERVFVNIMQRMSGIATETAKYVAVVEKLKLQNPPLIAATRKTPWMHVDKKAVAVGGGGTHRLDLHDGVLMKDNHLALLQQEMSLRSEADAISYAIQHAKITDKNIAIEVEVKTDEAAFVATTTWKKKNLNNTFILLLDNYPPARLKLVIEKIKRENNDIYIEASGGVRLSNIVAFAKTRADVISIGSLTHSSKASDLSLDIVK